MATPRPSRRAPPACVDKFAIAKRDRLSAVRGPVKSVGSIPRRCKRSVGYRSIPAERQNFFNASQSTAATAMRGSGSSRFAVSSHSGHNFRQCLQPLAQAAGPDVQMVPCGVDSARRGARGAALAAGARKGVKDEGRRCLRSRRQGTIQRPSFHSCHLSSCKQGGDQQHNHAPGLWGPEASSENSGPQAHFSGGAAPSRPTSRMQVRCCQRGFCGGRLTGPVPPPPPYAAAGRAVPAQS